ncbi:DUF4352 domain-containing protein [Smaragdicoccus niigatensis]|uniref:DUF4352 domain-containing protein n=1 Tax=Smaragdicoccus niigatensis TaxID=359359 RepID=UPI0003720312|nr:DUF4352 domain-containing protein [Smaragdicoccus niigatensis]
MSYPYGPNQQFPPPQHWPNQAPPTGHYPPPQPSWGAPQQGQPWGGHQPQLQFAAPTYYPAPRPPKSNKNRNIALSVVGVFVLLVVLVLVFAPSKSNEPVANASSSAVLTGTDALGKAKIGDRIKVTTDDGTAIITVKDLQSGQPADYVKPHGTMMQISVEIEVISGTWHVNPLYFSARSASGTTLSPDFFNGADDDLTYTDAKAGEKVRGTIQFDVPNGESISLVILTGVMFERIADWTAA